MEALFEKQDALLQATDMSIVRGFMDDVNLETPRLCIRGPRGVGKSTLLQQYVKQHYEPGSEEVKEVSETYPNFRPDCRLA